jgi:predicted transcriptional regulator
MSRGAKAVRLDPDQLRELADLARIAPALLPNHAARYAGVSRSSVYRFAAEHPRATVRDAQDRLRILRTWLDAWVMGRNCVAAMERGAAA